MAITITHAFVSAKTDGADATVVRPSNWNAALTTSMASGFLIGRNTAGAGAFEEITLGTNLSFTGTTLNAAAGATTWDTIGAAAASKTTANGAFNIVYNTAPTADNKVAWTFGETSAATNGTITSGFANQALLSCETLAASTQSPFQIKIRGAIALQASSTATQMVFANGAIGTPSVTFAGALTSGFWSNGSNIQASVAGASAFTCNTTKFLISYAGSSTSPAITDGTSTNTGLQWPATNTMAIVNSTAGELVRFVGTGASGAGNLQPGTNGALKLGAAALGFGALYLDYTNTATVGAVTINKPSGRVIMAAAGTSFTLTNSLITANSHIFLSADSAPGNIVAVQFYAVPAAGSCTINAVPAVTNQTNIDFLVVNAD